MFPSLVYVIQSCSEQLEEVEISCVPTEYIWGCGDSSTLLLPLLCSKWLRQHHPSWLWHHLLMTMTSPSLWHYSSWLWHHSSWLWYHSSWLWHHPHDYGITSWLRHYPFMIMASPPHNYNIIPSRLWHHLLMIMTSSLHDYGITSSWLWHHPLMTMWTDRVVRQVGICRVL